MSRDNPIIEFLAFAAREGLRRAFDNLDLPLAARHYVDLQTASAWEVGRDCKKELADIVFDLRRGDTRRSRSKRIPGIA
jgi:hypothetical protein